MTVCDPALSAGRIFDVVPAAGPPVPLVCVCLVMALSLLIRRPHSVRVSARCVRATGWSPAGPRGCDAAGYTNAGEVRAGGDGRDQAGHTRGGHDGKCGQGLHRGVQVRLRAQGQVGCVFCQW